MSAASKMVFSAALGLLLVTASGAMAADPAGKVLSLKGSAYANDAGGNLRPLKRGQEVFEKELVCTDTDSQLQLKMKDGALYTLQSGSRLDINEYRYTDYDSQDNAVSLELVEGALRTVSGAVGKLNPNAYTLKAGTASIGIRGTEFEVDYGDSPAAPLEEWCARK
jgi:hypothetical protein